MSSAPVTPAASTTPDGTFDVEAIRRDFPILSVTTRGHPLAYLDNGATSQKPQVVIDALVRYYTTMNANVHRSPHELAERATMAYEQARARVGQFVNAAGPENVVWTRGTTEAINLVAASWGRKNLSAGDTVLLTEMEHHSNLVPWHFLKQSLGIELAFVPVTDDGLLDMDAARAMLAAGPKLFGFQAKSNALGTVNPVAELCALARKHGVATLVDGAQAAPHGAVDVQAMGCDWFAFSGHKMLAPMGVGCLITRTERYAEMDPYQGGGEMIKRVKLQSSSYMDPPLCFEAGTPSVGDVVALETAIDYLESHDLDAIHAHETHLTRLALDGLAEIGVRTYGPGDAALRAGIVGFDVPGVHPHDVATLLDGRGVAVRAGHHCCQPLMRRYDVMATTRASFYLYNTEDEVRRLIEGVQHVQKVFKR